MNTTVRTRPLTIRRYGNQWGLYVGAELIDVYADKHTAQAAREYATWIGWKIRGNRP